MEKSEKEFISIPVKPEVQLKKNQKLSLGSEKRNMEIHGSCGCSEIVRKGAILIGLHDNFLSVILMFISGFCITNPHYLRNIFGYDVRLDSTVMENYFVGAGAASFLLFIISCTLMLGVMCRLPKWVYPWLLLKPFISMVYIGVMFYFCGILADDLYAFAIWSTTIIMFIVCSTLYKCTTVSMCYYSMMNMKGSPTV